MKPDHRLDILSSIIDIAGKTQDGCSIFRCKPQVLLQKIIEGKFGALRADF